MGNLIDIAVVLVLVICVVFGMYQGGVVSALHTIGLFLSWGAAYMYYPRMALYIQSDQELFKLFVHYTEGAKRITTALGRTPIATMSPSSVQQVIADSNMPFPFDKLIAQNVSGRVFAPLGVSTIGDYFNYSVVTVAINIVSFLIIFLLTYVILCVIINMVNYVIRFPMVRQLDMVAGGLLGFFRGIFMVHAIFSLIPIALAILPPNIEIVQEILDTSRYIPAYYEGNYILHFVHGWIPDL